MSDAIRVLIVDDHPVVRDGLAAVLDTQPDLEVAGVADTGEAALRQVEALAPDVVLMDVRMPEMDGVTATAKISAAHPDVRVVVLTTYDADADIVAAIEAGAVGYLLKQADREELCTAVRTAAAGGSALSPAVATKVLGRMRGETGGGLSPREMEVLAAVARGRNNNADRPGPASQRGHDQDPPAAHLRQARRRGPHRRRHHRGRTRHHPTRRLRRGRPAGSPESVKWSMAVPTVMVIMGAWADRRGTKQGTSIGST